MRVSKGAKKRAEKPSSYTAWFTVKIEREAVDRLSPSEGGCFTKVSRSVRVPHEFPRCIIKAYARARQRAVAPLDFALTLRGPTAAAIEASERQYLREGSVR